VQAVDSGAVAQLARQRYPDQPERIPEAIRNARIHAIEDKVESARNRRNSGSVGA
jgi:tRNA nucleotidyltransferase (CCA-adding enzyme)